MTSWRCRIGLHRWEKWSDTRSFTATIKGYWSLGVYVPVVPPQDVTEYRQMRECRDCGRAQRREVKNV